jgi:SAM-dependent methyltransferase
MIVKMKRLVVDWLRKSICPSYGSQLTDLQKRIYNEGERLIPGITHDMCEVVRHKSSYEFFRSVIEQDIATFPELQQKEEISIVDFGFGVGHGCFSLSKIKNSHITGIDISADCLKYAKQFYAADNISYEICDLAEYVNKMPEFDYVVSRGVFEHVPGGLDVAFSTRWRQRLIFDVPYNEPEGPNPHHLISGIREEHFAKFSGSELFYQDLAGVIYDGKHKPEFPNMIMCVSSHSGLPPVGEMRMKFPVPAWRL